MDIRLVEAADSAQVRTVISRAFMDGPLIDRLFPADEYQTSSLRLDAVAVFYAPSVEFFCTVGSGLVAEEAGDVLGAVLWNAPSATPSTSLPSAGGVAALMLGTRASQLGAAMAAAREGAPPAEGTYIPDVSVVPESQGRGIGRDLMAAAIDRAGSDGMWLETTNPRNIPFYERAGFQVTHTGLLGDFGIPMTRMVSR